MNIAVAVLGDVSRNVIVRKVSSTINHPGKRTKDDSLTIAAYNNGSHLMKSYALDEPFDSIILDTADPTFDAVVEYLGRKKFEGKTYVIGIKPGTSYGTLEVTDTFRRDIQSIIRGIEKNFTPGAYI